MSDNSSSSDASDFFECYKECGDNDCGNLFEGFKKSSQKIDEILKFNQIVSKLKVSNDSTRNKTKIRNFRSLWHKIFHHNYFLRSV